MKKVYIITYDLKEEGQNYTEILKRIKSYGTWAKLGRSEYIVVSNQTHTEIRDYLKGALDLNDALFVGTLNAPAAWSGMPENVSKWIISNLS